MDGHLDTEAEQPMSNALSMFKSISGNVPFKRHRHSKKIKIEELIERNGIANKRPLGGQRLENWSWLE